MKILFLLALVAVVGRASAALGPFPVQSTTAFDLVLGFLRPDETVIHGLISFDRDAGAVALNIQVRFRKMSQVGNPAQGWKDTRGRYYSFLILILI